MEGGSSWALHLQRQQTMPFDILSHSTDLHDVFQDLTLPTWFHRDCSLPSRDHERMPSTGKALVERAVNCHCYDFQPSLLPQTVCRPLVWALTRFLVRFLTMPYEQRCPFCPCSLVQLLWAGDGLCAGPGMPAAVVQLGPPPLWRVGHILLDMVEV